MYFFLRRNVNNFVLNSCCGRDCGKVHKSFRHWGSKTLKERVQIVAPKFHLFGHVHETPGFHTEGNTTFINSAVDFQLKGHYFDYFV